MIIKLKAQETFQRFIIAMRCESAIMDFLCPKKHIHYSFFFLNQFNNIHQVPPKVIKKQTHLCLAATYAAGSDASCFVESRQNLGDTSVRDEQLSRYVAGPDADQSQLHYPLSHAVRQRSPVDKNSTQLINTGLSCDQKEEKLPITYIFKDQVERYCIYNNN